VLPLEASPMIGSRLGPKLVLEHKGTSDFKTGFAAGAFTDTPFISSGSFSPDRTGPSRWRRSSGRGWSRVGMNSVQAELLCRDNKSLQSGGMNCRPWEYNLMPWGKRQASWDFGHARVKKTS